MGNCVPLIQPERQSIRTYWNVPLETITSYEMELFKKLHASEQCSSHYIRGVPCLLTAALSYLRSFTQNNAREGISDSRQVPVNAPFLRDFRILLHTIRAPINNTLEAFVMARVNSFRPSALLADAPDNLFNQAEKHCAVGTEHVQSLAFQVILKFLLQLPEPLVPGTVLVQCISILYSYHTEPRKRAEALKDLVFNLPSTTSWWEKSTTLCVLCTFFHELATFLARTSGSIPSDRERDPVYHTRSTYTLQLAQILAQVFHRTPLPARQKDSSSATSDQWVVSDEVRLLHLLLEYPSITNPYVHRESMCPTCGYVVDSPQALRALSEAGSHKKAEEEHHELAEQKSTCPYCTSSPQKRPIAVQFSSGKSGDTENYSFNLKTPYQAFLEPRSYPMEWDGANMFPVRPSVERRQAVNPLGQLAHHNSKSQPRCGILPWSSLERIAPSLERNWQYAVQPTTVLL